MKFQFLAKKITMSPIPIFDKPTVRKSMRVSGEDLAYVMTQTGGRPDFLYASSFR